ncbi:hypothetical protein [Microbacterium sp. AK031]|uniref:hypothetical protein n=1 Tax=Microbacterium sp. AK031 TaxID=2723076 RepID=UPI002169E643|nr:hypothetical protein [Microbacterium sp. AK031]MCS3844723.1 hypothetical protein [Microbacterium sp. AK031]
MVQGETTTGDRVIRIIGLLLTVLCAAPFLVPLVFRSGSRSAAYGWSLVTYVLVGVGLIAALLTA